MGIPSPGEAPAELPILLLAGLVAWVIVVAVRPESLLVLLAVLALLVQGPLYYFLGWTRAAWLPYLLSAMAAVRVPMAWSGKRAPPVDTQACRPLYFTLGALGLYAVALVAAAVWNRPGLGQLAAGFKATLTYWVITTLLLLDRDAERGYPRLWSLFYVAFFLQLPLVLFQHFYIVPLRPDTTETRLDAVVGSFGGNMYGGGASASLAVFTLFVVAYQLSRLLRGRAGAVPSVIVLATGLVIILAGEVKAVFFWIPAVVIFLHRARFASEPLRSALAMVATVAVLAVIYVTYDTFYWDQSRAYNVAQRVEEMSYPLDPSFVNRRTGEVSRGASISLWFSDGEVDAAHRVFGHGPGSSHVSATVGPGEVAERFAPLHIAATTMARLLWDAGILGLLSFSAIILGALVMAARLGNHVGVSPDEQARLEALGALLLISCSLLVYNRSLIDDPAISLLLAFAVGYTGSRWLLVARRASATASAADPRVPAGLHATSP